MITLQLTNNQSTQMTDRTAFRGRLHFCSNFYPRRLHFRGRYYQTAEHAYQATKMTSLVDHNQIMAASSPGAAKRLGNLLPTLKHWDDIKEHIMLEVLRAKFTDHPLAEMLLATDTEELIEHNTWGDTYWGMCGGVGENKLGKLLMQVRKELKEQVT